MTNSLLEWNDSFLIGITELDHEHQILIKDINRLHGELAGHDQKSDIEKCLGDIYARMQAHFALEEHVMKEHGYEYFDEHRREHRELLDTYTEYMMQFLNAAGLSSTDPIKEVLTHWVIDHITTSDKKMSLMVQDQ